MKTEIVAEEQTHIKTHYGPLVNMVRKYQLVMKNISGARRCATAASVSSPQQLSAEFFSN